MTKKKICFSTITRSPHYLIMANFLINSCKKFHPDIPFIHINEYMVETILKEKNIKVQLLLPFVGEMLSEQYDLVVHFDADSIVTGKLTELIEEEYDVASVKNNNVFLQGGMCVPGFSRINKLTGKEISIENYCNAGLHACRNIDFWKEWQKCNLEYHDECKLGEQDTMNDVFYSGKYNALVLDTFDKPYYYGVANSWGQESHYTSWKEIMLKDDLLYLYKKQIKVLHAAGGDSTEVKFKFDEMFKPDVAKWLKGKTRY